MEITSKELCRLDHNTNSIKVKKPKSHNFKKYKKHCNSSRRHIMDRILNMDKDVSSSEFSSRRRRDWSGTPIMRKREYVCIFKSKKNKCKLIIPQIKQMPEIIVDENTTIHNSFELLSCVNVNDLIEKLKEYSIIATINKYCFEENNFVRIEPIIKKNVCNYENYKYLHEYVVEKAEFIMLHHKFNNINDIITYFHENPHNEFVWMGIQLSFIGSVKYEYYDQATLCASNGTNLRSVYTAEFSLSKLNSSV